MVDYDPLFSGGPAPTTNDDPQSAVGLPDTAGDVSLGSGGRITLRFTDNFLSGSDSSEPDLHIFETGPDVEDTFVEVSRDGIVFFPVGKVLGSTSSIDIDSFGFNSSDRLFFVRLTDDPNEGDTSGTFVGADIDAVGAISTAVVTETCDAPALGNLSAIGLASNNSPFIACSIVGRPGVDIIVLAESFGSPSVDTELFLAPISVPAAEVRTSPLAVSNDNFGPGIVPIINRPLGLSTDSVVTLDNLSPGAYCAYAFTAPGSSNGMISIQFGNIDLFR